MSGSADDNALRVRIEASSILENERYSGVGQYIHQLSNSFISSNYHTELFSGPFFSTDKLDSKPNKWQTLANKTYRKFVNSGLRLPVDSKKESDLTIFPNFAALPTKNTKITATVIHDLTYIFYPDMVESKNLAYLQKAVPQAINQSDFLITVSETSKKSLVDIFGINPDLCIVTPIPPDPIFFSATELSDGQRNKYGIPNAPYFLFLGNIEPRKNLSLLIDAYLKLEVNIRRAHPLVIAGAVGWKSTEVGKKIDEARQNGDTIITPGYIDEEDKQSLFKSARLFIFPSIYEGYGIPPVEAMAAGTPVVLSDIPVLREVGRNFATYADPTNSDSLAEAIANSIKNSTSQSTEAKEYVRSLNWGDNISSILDMYKHLR